MGYAVIAMRFMLAMEIIEAENVTSWKAFMASWRLTKPLRRQLFILGMALALCLLALSYYAAKFNYLNIIEGEFPEEFFPRTIIAILTFVYLWSFLWAACLYRTLTTSR